MIRFLCVRSFIILSQFFLFVKNFFILFCCSELFCPATTFISYHLSPCLSRSFLMIFIMYRSDRSPSVTFYNIILFSPCQELISSMICYILSYFSDVDYIIMNTRCMSSCFSQIFLCSFHNIF